MAIDYSKYSLEDLQSALCGIDGEKHPENYRALQERIALKHASLAKDDLGTPNVPLYAGALTRFGATMVDGLILIPFIFLYFKLGTQSFTAALLGFPLVQAAFLYYQVWFHARYGATPGKMALGIKVVDDSLAPIGFRKAWKRSWADIGIRCLLVMLAMGNILNFEAQFPMDSIKVLSGVIKSGVYRLVEFLANLWILSEALVCLTNKRRKAIHDYIADTVVILRNGPAA